MNITIIAVGKLKEAYLKAAVNEYEKRLSRYAFVRIIEAEDEKCAENAGEKADDTEAETGTDAVETAEPEEEPPEDGRTGGASNASWTLA